MGLGRGIPEFAGQLCCRCLVFVYEDDPAAEAMRGILEEDEDALRDPLACGCPVHGNDRVKDPCTGDVRTHVHRFVSFVRVGEDSGYRLG